MVRLGGPPHPLGLDEEDGGDPGDPYPLASVDDRVIVIIPYAIYTVCGVGGK